MKLLISILLVALATQAYAQLQCYECEDCENLDTDSVSAITCEVDTTTETDTTTDSTTTDDTTTTTTDETTTNDDTTTTDDTTATDTTDDTTTPSDSGESGDGDTVLKVIQQQSNNPRIIPIVFRQRRETTDIEFRCFRVEVADGDNVKTNRGCIQYDTDDDVTCNSIYDEPPKSCHLCNENECNSSSMLVSSLVALVVSILVTSRLL